MTGILFVRTYLYLQYVQDFFIDRGNFPDKQTRQWDELPNVSLACCGWILDCTFYTYGIHASERVPLCATCLRNWLLHHACYAVHGRACTCRRECASSSRASITRNTQHSLKNCCSMLASWTAKQDCRSFELLGMHPCQEEPCVTQP